MGANPPQAEADGDAEWLLERDAAALACAWITSAIDYPRAAEQARAIEQEAAARGQPRVGWLSQSWAAIPLATGWRAGLTNTERLNGVRQTLAELRSQGWPRAIWLAEAAMGLRLEDWRDDMPQIVGHLEAQPPASEDKRPAVERFWTDAALASLLATQGRFDDGLQHGLRAQAAAASLGHDAMTSLIAHRLAYLFLSSGDCEGGLAVIPAGIEAAERLHWRTHPMHYNLLLAQLQSNQHNQAGAWLESHPWLVDPTELATSAPFLRPVLAAIRQRQGRDTEAAALLVDDEAAFAAGAYERLGPVQANRAWLIAGIELAQGQPQAARHRVERYLASQEAAGSPPLSPWNGTQLYDTLSRACDALGEPTAAYQALRRSRDCCFAWVGQSMRARLLALDTLSRQSDPATLDGRLAAMDAAVLRAHAEAARSALEQRNGYFMKVVHDIRNPVNGLIGMTSLLMLSQLDERQRTFLSLAESSAQMLLRLCNDVLDLAKIDAGRFELNLQEADLARSLQEVAKTFVPLMEAKGLDFEIRFETPLPPGLWCDPLRIQQIAMNLLANAMRFTERGRVALIARWTASQKDPEVGELAVTVRDTGVGMAPHAQSRLFQEFSQVGPAPPGEHGGTGLGLAVCRQLLQLMSGDIRVRSQVGQGSDFRFAVPLRVVTVEARV